MGLEYDAAGGSGSTMRTLVGQIALLAGANAWIDRAGALRLGRLQDTAYQVGPLRYYESGLTLEGADFVLGALEVTVPVTQQGDSGAQESREGLFRPAGGGHPGNPLFLPVVQSDRVQPGMADLAGPALAPCPD